MTAVYRVVLPVLYIRVLNGPFFGRDFFDQQGAFRQVVSDLPIIWPHVGSSIHLHFGFPAISFSGCM